MVLLDITGFDWDTGNDNKSLLKHGVSQHEAEQVFFNHPLLIVGDVKHTQQEHRLHLYGKNDKGQLRHITFTIRGSKARVISARSMHKRSVNFMKKIPEFKTEQAEREFWNTHDSTEYLDMSKARLVIFPDLKKSTKSISLRLPEDMLYKLKSKANSMDVPYQSLLKTWIAEKVG